MVLRLGRQKISSAFTLVELIVSMTVLVIIVAFVGSLVAAAQSGTSQVLRHMSADAQARLVFDRMGNDFNRMLKRKDVDYVFSKAPASPVANDAMFFFSEAPAYIDDPGSTHGLTSLVGYRINSNYQLERLGKLLDWDGQAAPTSNPPTPGGLPFLTFPGGVPNASPATAPDPATTILGIWGAGGSNTLGTAPSFTDGTDADYNLLADGVFRLSFCFLENQTVGSASPSPSYVSPPSPALPGAGTYPLGYTAGTTTVHVTAIVVALAILDDTARQIGTITQNTVSALPNPTVLPMASAWNGDLAAKTFSTSSGLTPQAASQIRIYERTFYLNSPATSVTP